MIDDVRLVPEPSSALLAILGGLAGLIAYRPRTRTTRKAILSTLTLAIAGSITAHADLVQNGGFGSLAGLPNNEYSVAAPTVWTAPSGTQGLGFIYGPDGADATGAVINNGGHYLWGPNNPGSGGNSMNDLPATSPSGGNFYASDSDGGFALPISQTITGLIPGETYELFFEWAAAQLRNGSGTFWNGETDSSWRVTLGSAGTQSTHLEHIPNHGFSGWMEETMTFTIPATSTGSEILTFLAVGGPGGLPPVAILDGVSLNPVPEPSCVLSLLAGAVMAMARRRARPNS